MLPSIFAYGVFYGVLILVFLSIIHIIITIFIGKRLKYKTHFDLSRDEFADTLRRMADLHPKEIDFESAIESLSSNYAIPKEKLCAILIDYVHLLAKQTSEEK
jgi:hypothetical protein